MNVAASTSRPVRVLIVDDSAVVRELLREIMEVDPGLTVVGMAKNGEEGVRLATEQRPDVITMDIHMPKLNGFEATQQIMHRHPTPIVIISGSLDTTEVNISFQAMAAGAVAVLQRPRGVGHPDFAAESRALVQAVKSMAEVKVVRRWQPGPVNTATLPAPVRSPSIAVAEPRPVEVIAIGASTGGPVALQVLLSRLPAGLPFPIIIVQHMTDGFIRGFVDWLSRSVRFPIHLAAHNEMMQPGHAYFAPDGTHLGVGRSGRLQLIDSPPERGLRPAVSVLFRSVAAVYGSRTVAILMTGMGSDGAAELKQLKDLGATTVAQDRDSSVIFGMPGEAVKRDAATWILPPEEIASLLIQLSVSSPSSPAVPS
jgi:two-component system chemotaxis response regulator CheB